MTPFGLPRTLSVSMLTRMCAGLFVVLLLLPCPARGRAADTTLYRLFLLDGASLVSYGEFARVADRVVLSIPVGAMDGSNLQLVSIPQSAVDWARTDEYSEAVRARQFADSHGPSYFALLGNRVTEALNDIRATEDPRRQLSMAQEARRNLARWPVENFGYRADDVARMVDMFDEVISELRIASGESGFDLRFSANTSPAPMPTLLPPPGARESFEQALAVARLSDDPGERLSLLHAVTAALREPARHGGWASKLHGEAAAEYAMELHVEQRYRDLVARMMALANQRATRADVPGTQAVIRMALEADDRLGGRRMREVASLLAYLDLKVAEARRLREARDAWAARRRLFDAYRQKISASLEQLRVSKPWLEAIRDGRPINPAIVDRHEQRTVMARRVFELTEPPAELGVAQSLYVASFHMAQRAANGSRLAVSFNDANRGRDASAAAAGALMLLEQADEELSRVVASPNR